MELLTPHAPRPSLRHDHAVSSVVAAALIFALFSTTFALWTVITMPEWIADREVSHQTGVVADFADTQGGLERLSAAGEAGPVTTDIRMAPRPIPLLQRATALGGLGFEDGLDIDLATTGAVLHLSDGDVRGPPAATAEGTAATGVASIEGLKLAMQSDVQGGTGATASVTARVSGTGGTVTATLVHTRQPTACDAEEIRLEVGSATNVLLCGASRSLPSPFTIALLEPGLGFRSALAGIDAPYTITFTTQTVDGASHIVSATYSLVHTDSEGRLRAIGSGEATDFARDLPGGRLVFTGEPVHHVAQTIAWEAGAVTVAQEDGQALARPPRMNLAADGTDGFVDWTIIRLQGDVADRSGADSATVVVRHVATSTVLVQADTASFEVSGGADAAWRQGLTDLVAASGVPDADVSGADGKARLDLTQGSITSWWLHLRIIEAKVALT